MRLTRIHIDEPLGQSSRVTLRGAAANHVRQVLRLGPADEIVVFDGRGGEYAARIDELRKDTLLIAVGEHRLIERESPLAVTLAQGVSRGERMDLVVQKATELGVRRIAPLLTERTVVRLDAKQADAKRRHWRGIAIAACEQCGRNIVPQIALPVTLTAFLSSLEPDAVRVLLSPAGGSKVSDLEPTDAPLTLLIGPEGGLCESEQRVAIEAGFRVVNLGPRVLRTETAAIAALAAIQQHLGDI
ncbi:MAG: 16S rRNA (uracil(1498)-N(3))-methyltransferase [Steroidobacteraceae bacterium]